MVLNITTELLFSALQREKATGELVPLQKDFYTQTSTFMDALDKTSVADENSKQLENARKMLVSLKERRKQKLLLYVAYNKPLPAVVPEEDEALYNEVRQVLNRDDRQIKISRLKINADIPEVLTTQGRRIGPYKQGEIVEVSNNNDAEFIVKNKIGEIVA